jgi:hypothetical protein
MRIINLQRADNNNSSIPDGKKRINQAIKNRVCVCSSFAYRQVAPAYRKSSGS